MSAKIKETIRRGNWSEKDKEQFAMERHILVNWGLSNEEMVLLTKPQCMQPIQSSDYWSTPPQGFLKLNFDGVSKGSLGNDGFIFIVQTSQEEMAGFGEDAVFFLGKYFWSRKEKVVVNKEPNRSR